METVQIQISGKAGSHKSAISRVISDSLLALGVECHTNAESVETPAADLTGKVCAEIVISQSSLY